MKQKTKNNWGSNDKCWNVYGKNKFNFSQNNFMEKNTYKTQKRRFYDVICITHYITNHILVLMLATK